MNSGAAEGAVSAVTFEGKVSVALERSHDDTRPITLPYLIYAHVIPS